MKSKSNDGKKICDSNAKKGCLVSTQISELPRIVVGYAGDISL